MSARAAAMIGVGAALALAAGFAAGAQAPGRNGAAETQAQAKAKPGPGGPPEGMELPDLVAGLKATPGCLGVEAARTQGGKNVLFAWFEDKAALTAWYRSEMHQEVMGMTGGAIRKDAMKEVPDGTPVLAIASITFAEKPHFEGFPMPVSQISIELYQPVSGGVFLGGTFAPPGLKVPGLKDATPKSQAKGEPKPKG